MWILTAGGAIGCGSWGTLPVGLSRGHGSYISGYISVTGRHRDEKNTSIGAWLEMWERNEGKNGSLEGEEIFHASRNRNELTKP